MDPVKKGIMTIEKCITCSTKISHGVYCDKCRVGVRAKISKAILRKLEERNRTCG